MPVEFKDYYATLEVPREASEDDVRKAFRKLARKYHPDVAKDKKTAEEKFKEINEAYEVLSDPEKRRKYDELGPNWQQGAEFRPPPGWNAGSAYQESSPDGGAYEFRFEGAGFSDFFENLFGSGGRFGRGGADDFIHAAGSGANGRTGPLKGHDIEGEIMVTLNEAMHGATREIGLQRVDPRTGKAETQTFKVRIPPGVQDGKLIRVPGKGGEGLNGGPAGDLFLRVRFAAHPDFRADGADLHHELDLAPWEAALGAELTVPTLDGRIKMRIPAGTDTGRKLRVRGKGLPRPKSSERGDLYVTATVRTPPQLNSEERDLWEKLSRVSRFNPREHSGANGA
jgi:curved DNA-binding protein